MAVPAVGAGDAVVLAEHARDADGDRLLAAVEVRGAVHLAAQEQRLDRLLEAADPQHRAVGVAVERAIGLAPGRRDAGRGLGERRLLLACGHSVDFPSLKVGSN